MIEVVEEITRLKKQHERTREAFQQAADSVKLWYEAYIALLPWYRRWPIRIQVAVLGLYYRWRR